MDKKEKLKEYQKEYQKEYRENNKEQIKEQSKEYYKNKRKIDPLYRLKHNLRSSISNSLKRKDFTKITKTEIILGMSFSNFKLYIESKFEPWMNWKNYGLWNGELNYGWDIDHIIPTSSVETEEDMLKLNHYTNLQPLCSQVNRYIKRDNIEIKN